MTITEAWFDEAKYISHEKFQSSGAETFMMAVDHGRRDESAWVMYSVRDGVFHVVDQGIWKKRPSRGWARHVRRMKCRTRKKF